MASIVEIKRRADIREVWAALGGGKLRANRGRAFWRGGDGHSVSLRPDRDTWHDFVSGEGGDALALIIRANNCDFKTALNWLADFTGLHHDDRRDRRRPDHSAREHADWATDLRWARWWRIVAEQLAEDALAQLPPWHPERRPLTALLQAIRLGEGSLVAEYRGWRRSRPQLTRVMCLAGQRADVRRQRQLAAYISDMARA